MIASMGDIHMRGDRVLISSVGLWEGLLAADYMEPLPCDPMLGGLPPMPLSMGSKPQGYGIKLSAKSWGSMIVSVAREHIHARLHHGTTAYEMFT